MYYYSIMKFFIIGNIGDGKSFLAKLLSKITGYRVYSIDNFRKKYNNLVTLQGENIAYDIFKKTVIAAENGIIEMTGTGKHYESIIIFCPNKIVIKVLPKNGKKIKSKNNLPYELDIDESLRRNDIILADKGCDLIYDAKDPESFWQIFSVLFPQWKEDIILHKK